MIPAVYTRTRHIPGPVSWRALAWLTDKCIGFATGCIGQDGLEPDTLYRASGGKLVKVD